MMIAERASARFAVGAFALAALAVSARRPAPVAPAAIECEARETRTAHGHARLGVISVVGTPNYEAAVREIEPLATAFGRCARETTRVTIYAHVSNQHITQLDVLGDSDDAALCVQQLVLLMGLPIADEVDVMIPVDLVR